ncbi:Integrin alpha-D [Camelus dromedarius]|uniref:Integrin alpha-D n=1 Tax=Camelus dromedarius TaxID=9838 RepID=A0A5N4CXA1_CAMDR|nr:Integrin alpha-D [Camelus dromedarius]
MRLVVGAPLEVVSVRKTGWLYNCVVATGLCRPILLDTPLEAVNMSLGLSMAASTNSSWLLIISTVPAALPECPNQEMNIVFLIDDSGSIDPTDFKQMKNFVRAVMGQFKGTNTLVKTGLPRPGQCNGGGFSKFQTSPHPQSLVDPIVQLTGLTFTATGIRTVVEELFHSKNGACKSAKKILIVITDGQKYEDPLEYSDVIPQAEKASIIRYAIGVHPLPRGRCFQKPTARQELNITGPAPSKDHVFKVDNFAALGSIQKRLQEKIFSVEGKWADGPVLGAVGSFSWSGGAFLYPPKMSPTFINMSQENGDMRDSYLGETGLRLEGYSTELALWKGVQNLVLGAPRHQHTGKVVLFTQVSRQWKPKAEVTGTQIGSYFGASLCSVDVDRDGSSDLVLIGAPHYYEQTRGGRVSVCPLPKGWAKWQCGVILHGEQGHPWSRFGAALTVMGDVNGGKLMDVAIRAPGEQENRGAIYLFHGTSGLSISPSAQPGSQLSPRLQYFWQSLSGCQDITQDGLVDLAVGAQGHVLLFRSLPVLNVEVAMIFTPPEVAKAVYWCWEDVPATLEIGDTRVCLTIHESSQDQLRDVQSSVKYDLALDPGRLIPRAIFDETKNWTLTRRKILGLGDHCETLKLFLPGCVEDVVNPIILWLNFSLVGEPIPSSQNLRPVLAMGSQDLFTASTLVVGSSLDLNVTVNVWNEGKDSYGTVISFHYPAGLSYRQVLGIQGTFMVTFDVSYKATLGDKLLLTANASSENNKPASSKSNFQLELPVKYAVYTVISSQEDSTKYFNFSASDEKRRKEAEHQYRVNNLGQPDLALSIHFWVPILLNSVAVWDMAVVAPSQVPSLPCVSEREPPQHPDFQTPGSLMLDCSIADCLRFNCDIPSFGVQEELDFILKGKLSFGWVSQMVTVLEEYELYDPVPLIVSSSMGGLLLLALITAILYRCGFFIREYKEMMGDKSEDTATLSGEDFTCEAPN